MSTILVLAEDDLRRILREELQRLRGPQAAPEDRRVGQTEAAARAGVCPATIRAWADAGRIKKYGEGRGVRYSLAEVLSVAPSDAPAASAEEWAEAQMRKHQ